MQRRGQLTVFLAVGIIIIIALILFYLYGQPSLIRGDDPSDLNANIQIQPIDNLIHTCLQTVTEEGLRNIGLNGGYIRNRPENVNIQLTANLRIPIYYEESGPPLLPSLEYMAQELSTFIEREMRFCFDDFAHIEKSYRQITFGDTTSVVNIGTNGVSSTIELPISVLTDRKKVDRKQYSVTIPLHLKAIHTEVARIIEATRSCEETQKMFLTNAINTCGESANGIEVTELIEDENDGISLLLAAANQQCSAHELPIQNQYVQKREMLPFSGCTEDPYACTVTTIDITTHLRPPPLQLNCRRFHKVKTELKRNRNIHQLFDPSYTTTPFTFFFATIINVDSSGNCNLC